MFTRVPRSVWWYAGLIVLLFVIVALASYSIIHRLEVFYPDAKYSDEISQLSVAIWTLTMGFMFLAGALGLWAIRSTASVEGRRRLGRFVDAMDYLSDGLLVLDKRSQVTASNPAARRLSPKAMPEHALAPLAEMFPCLSAEDVSRLVDMRYPQELERDCVYPHGLRTLRFRSQPSEDVILALVSDVTDQRSMEIRRRQVAQLQMVGRIAGGVAHDFNNILCAISGHAALLKRFDSDPHAVRKSVDIIIDETQKGALLSRQLLELSRSGEAGSPSENLTGNVEEAAGLLRVALSPEWTVKTRLDGQYPAVPLTPPQVEQVVLNLGMLAVDVQPRPGTVLITLNKPGQGHLLDVGDPYVAVIMISVETPTVEVPAVMTVNPSGQGMDEGGVISSVVRSMIEEARGRIDLLTAPGGLCVYRVCLPHIDVVCEAEPEDHVPVDAFVTRWKVLLAEEGRDMRGLEKRLIAMGVTVERRDTVAALLAAVDALQYLDVIVLDKRLLGPEAVGLLRALRKLCPHVGMVVLCHDPRQESSDVGVASIVFESAAGKIERLVHAMVSARAAAGI